MNTVESFVHTHMYGYSFQVVTPEVKMHVISDVTRKFSSRYLLTRRKINASDLLLTSKFGVLRQIWREIARHVGNNVHLNLSISYCTLQHMSRDTKCCALVKNHNIAQDGVHVAGNITDSHRNIPKSKESVSKLLFKRPISWKRFLGDKNLY